MASEHYNPDGPGVNNGNYFGFPYPPEESRLVLVSVPWDVTASYMGGAVYGPDAIIGASVQLDLHDPHAPGEWKRGIGTAGIDYSIQEASLLLRHDARKVIAYLESGKTESDDSVRRRLDRVNEGSLRLNENVNAESSRWLEQGKLVGLVGGDHSSPFGFVRALAAREERFGVLHIDAHRDLRPAYEGFIHSHASIMYNILEQIPQVERLVQVGVRDYACEEQQYAENSLRVSSFEGARIAENRFTGVTWREQCDRIVAELPEKVYVSFDIDGLSPENCPHTGTPVPGGLSFDEAAYLLASVADSGRRIIGFDLCEVTPSRNPNDEWDANVGARVLYKLCALALKSNP